MRFVTLVKPLVLFQGQEDLEYRLGGVITVVEYFTQKTSYRTLKPNTVLFFSRRLFVVTKS